MDGDVLKEKFLEMLKRIPPGYYLPIGIFGAGVILLVIGLIQLLAPLEKNDPLMEGVVSVTPKPALVAIDVEGAVINPGVYSLPTGSRLKDALIAAGGLSTDADRAVVAKQLNLALKLTDGGKVYIPKVGEPALNGGGSTTTTQTLGATTGLININTATAEELDTLPGIGQATAQKIISARPFSSIEDLVAKKVVSKSVFEKIKEKVSVY